MKRHFTKLFLPLVAATGMVWADSCPASYNDFLTSADQAMKAFAGSGCSAVGNSSTSCNTGDNGAAATEDTEAETQDTSVGAALRALRTGLYSNGVRPNTEADFYIYFYTSSKCAACNKLMPEVVKEYAEIAKSKKVELILIGTEKKMCQVAGYISMYYAGFTGLWSGSNEVMALPGNIPPKKLPGAVFVDKEGNIIKSGKGKLILEWEKYTTHQK